MEKVPRDSAFARIEFKFADELLRSYVARVAASGDKPDWSGLDLDDKKIAHWNLVARITKLYMVVLSTLSEELLNSLNKTKGNLFKLNKFLALRQLTETQLTGITQGTWDLPQDVVSKKLFTQQVASMRCSVTHEEIKDKVCEEFDIGTVA